MTNLFRKEVNNNINDNRYGEIVLPISFGMSFSAVATLLLLILVILFFIKGEYTRKVHLPGIVMPSSGLIKITPQYAGYVTELMVTEGQHVIAGMPLYRISGERYNGKGAGMLAALSLSLKNQYTLLSSQQKLEQRDNNQQQQATQKHIASLKPQIKGAGQRLVQAEQQASLSISVMNRYKKLIRNHYVSDIEYQQKQIEVSSAQQNVEDQRQVLLQLHISMETAQGDLSHLIVQGESRKAELDRQLQGIRQQQDELSGQENFVLTAPLAGTVGAVLVRQGHSVKISESVMTLIPDNAHLQIELYATSQNAGFICPGQRVALRFAAFPYQKFGVHHGTIREISRTTLMPSDLLSVSPVTWKENEGHYRVIVEPEQTTILAYGKREPLRPGMTLEGDVSLDTRNLWEWLTEPLWSIKGTL